MNIHFTKSLPKAVKLLSFIVTGLFLFASCRQTNHNQVTNLKTDRLINPIGLESAPLLSWQILSATENHKQSAYQLLVATTPEKLDKDQADLWNSGKVISGNSTNTPYVGKELASGQRAYWKIRIWDQDDFATDYSEPAFWEMGLLNPADWKGEWISAVEESDSLPPALPAPYFCEINQPAVSFLKYTRNMAPLSGLLFTSTLPPKSSTILFTIKRPEPVPSTSVFNRVRGKKIIS